ncbi:hypothetical protein ACFPH6_01335 [Streptomyces xiangluensis]|uniref:N-acetylmuramoyl-L-alanine amidase n=1 Tax=Streptomyces xiangluensis TaxID=2665720 RepID=A0ABV8YFE5_9ACTN
MTPRRDAKASGHGHGIKALVVHWAPCVHGPVGEPSDLTAADARAVLDANVIGVVRTTTEGTDAIVGLATDEPGAGIGRFVSRNGAIAWS